MMKYIVIEKKTGQEFYFRSLKEIADMYTHLTYALVCRLYRNKWTAKKNHRSIQSIIDTIEIKDYVGHGMRNMEGRNMEEGDDE